MPKKKPKKRIRNKPIVSAESEKNFSENSEQIGLSSVSKKGNFQKYPKGEPNKVKILPSHRVIFENYKDNGFRNMGKAIRKTGVYSEGVATRPNQITKSKSWLALMDEQMPETHLALRHKEILDKRDMRKMVDDQGKVSYEDIGPNVQAVTKGLELAYRLRGSFQKEEQAPPSTVMYNLFYKPEVRDQMKVFEEGIRQSLYEEIARKNKKDIQDESQIRDAEYEQEGSGEGTEETGPADGTDQG